MFNGKSKTTIFDGEFTIIDGKLTIFDGKTW